MTKTSKSKILIVDDDTALLSLLRQRLERLGYEVFTASDGRSGLALAKSTGLDLVVLDIGFPNVRASDTRSLDGIEVLRRLRDSDRVPILMLSYTDSSAVKAMALTLGADDYVCKPFDHDELGARIQAILRRAGDRIQGDRILQYNRLRVDPGERRIWKDEVVIDIAGIEFDILYALARRPNHVFSREKLLDAARKEPNACNPKVIDVHIGKIRQKLEDNPGTPSLIVTVRGAGYRFEDARA